MALHKKCPTADFFLVRIFPYSDRIRRDTGIQSECGKIRTRKKSVFGHFSHNVDNWHEKTMNLELLQKSFEI